MYVKEDIKGEGTSTPAAEGAKSKALSHTTFGWDTQDYPSNWDFNLYPICEGTVTKIGHVTVKNREAPFINVDTKIGEYTVWAGIVLEGKINDIPIERGDIIGIKYLGEETGSRGFRYKNYYVRVVKAVSGV